MTVRCLRTLVAALAAATLLAIPSPTAAHTGVGASFKGPAGRYLVYAYDATPLEAGRLEYRVVLLNRRSGNPAYDVTTSVAARAARGPQRATGKISTFGNVVFFELPNPHPDHWVVSLQLDGPLGRGSTTFDAHGLPPEADDDPATVVEESASPWGYVGAGVVAVAVIAAATWAVRSVRRRRTTT